MKLRCIVYYASRHRLLTVIAGADSDNHGHHFDYIINTFVKSGMLANAIISELNNIVSSLR